ncbi:GIY-YIG nuclease family protein [uncultured Desulfuromonas sp.]|uniref:GIY-YIG nuclease family protein n=1 Tax=uncultured Desulfuromonas sp. TaxID=181013 RepID=UPI002AAB6FF1|nr:GIY-YIG nuclease family protein [uncultured Desulfuromonas sp.]
MAKSVFTDEDDALLAELGVEVETKKVVARTPREERIIAGFEEIQRFVEQNDRLPSSTEGNDIFERIYATRLNQIRSQQECRDLLSEFDNQGLLDGDVQNENADSCELTDDELLEELGVSVGAESDITNLRHVKPHAEKQAAEEIATRTVCDDFDKFKPLFEAVQNDLDTGLRKTLKFRKDSGFLKTDVKKGQFFIIGGQTAYVAEVGDVIKAPNGEFDARLRVIYSNGTESDILLRSVVRALYKDNASRLISDPSAGPLFSDVVDREDSESGTIYVLRSKSDHPLIAENRDVIHKIGVTGGAVEKRIANAKLDPTYLMADVEIVANYELYNINRNRLEKVLHKFLDNARLEIEVSDRFGNPVKPKEWFLVPLFIIDDVVEKIKEGTLDRYGYDIESASLVEK